MKQMTTYEYDKFNRTKRLTLRLKEEEYEYLRLKAFEERKNVQQVIVEEIFKKNNFKNRLTI